jgi:hypothetical protein
MKPIACPHEASVARSARTGCWDDSAKAHLKACVHCREAAEITGWLCSIARTEAEKWELPDAEQIWMNARILAMQDARERAFRPLAVAELVVTAAWTFALTGGLLWIWFGLRSLARSALGPAHAPMALPVSVSAAATALCLIALIFIKLFHPILSED